MRFEWHDNKAKQNAKKHGITFEEAMSFFIDPYQLAFYDPDHSEDEDREIMVAPSDKGRLLVVVYTIRVGTVRLISARCATKREAYDYAQGI